MTKSTYQKRKQARFSPYAKGVTSVDGISEGIRPLTEEESQFLEKFNQEFVDNRFTEEGTNLHDVIKEKHKDEIDALNDELKVLQEYLTNESKGYRKMDTQGRRELKRKKKEFQKRKPEIEDRLLEIDPRKGINSDNYRRSNDPMNYTNRCSRFLDLKDKNIKRKLLNWKNRSNLSEEDVLEVINTDLELY